MGEKTVINGTSYYISYYYDENGAPMGVNVNGSAYFFVKNLQGDITAIMSYTGTVVAKYTYDAWGKLLSVRDGNNQAVTSPTHIANLNPFRYRGYIYDTETGLYYLNSRYYDAEVGRFISPDQCISTGQGVLSFNMYAYCGNNPVNMADPTGKIGIWTFLAISGIFATILSIPSSEKQEATEKQINEARNEAKRADYKVKYNEEGKPSTVNISINTESVIDNVDSIARDYYYQALYDGTVKKANEYSIPVGNLMSVDHIRWEFSMHELAYYLGFDAATTTDLNIDETLFSMIRRAFGW